MLAWTPSWAATQIKELGQTRKEKKSLNIVKKNISEKLKPDSKTTSLVGTVFPVETGVLAVPPWPGNPNTEKSEGVQWTRSLMHHFLYPYLFFPLTMSFRSNGKEMKWLLSQLKIVRGNNPTRSSALSAAANA